MLSSPINKALDLQKCVGCLQNYTRINGCYLTQCVYTGYIDSWILSSLYILPYSAKRWQGKFANQSFQSFDEENVGKFKLLALN